jgi:hypothetical protein
MGKTCRSRILKGEFLFYCGGTKCVFREVANAVSINYAGGQVLRKRFRSSVLLVWILNMSY